MVMNPSITHLTEDLALTQTLLGTVAERRLTHASQEAVARGESFSALSGDLMAKMASLSTPATALGAWAEYSRDAMERAVLTWDVLRQRADRTNAHNAAGAPPVLIYDYEVVMEGRDLERPSNYMLLRILPPEGTEVFDWKRPYVIIDPRAGHGAGIGGFKHDSQVGVALADGHPVYFVAFHQYPEPGQTIADVTHTEAAFLREIRTRHPNSPLPIVVGNCQGGWATAILGAMYPALTGPLVLNGAPMSYWGGKLGQDPMRYGGGLNGGVTPALISADLNGGLFDGAHLVQNFESLNPGRTWFRKYADLFAAPETSAQRFLEFEEWWGGFYIMTKAEIRWIVENLFVGNKLSKNEAFLEPGRLIDLKRITAPIIVFASHGDNITPPAQALNWIVDTYSDETEIEVRGQRIIYMLHEKVGHLGIFVSSSVAKREHTEMASTLKTIEALAPGLYEMEIEDHKGEGIDAHFTVSFARRTMEQLQTQTGERYDEPAFAAVARASEAGAEVYEAGMGPMIRGLVSPELGQAAIAAHPMRTLRTAPASRTPGMASLAVSAETVRNNRKPANPENPFLAAEKLLGQMIETSWDMWRDWRELAQETRFFGMWSNPWALWYGEPNNHLRTRHNPASLHALPEVQSALSRLETGGLGEATIRALILLAGTRGDVRRDRLGRSAEVLSGWTPYNKITPQNRARIIHEQSLIARFATDEEALTTLPRLVRSPAEARKLREAIRYILGDEAEMEQDTRALLDRIEALIGVDAPEVSDAEVSDAKVSDAPAMGQPEPPKEPPAALNLSLELEPTPAPPAKPAPARKRRAPAAKASTARAATAKAPTSKTTATKTTATKATATKSASTSAETAKTTARKAPATRRKAPATPAATPQKDTPK